MTANPALVKERNVSPENVEYINQMHELLTKLIDSYTLDIPYDEAEAVVKSANKTLSDLWGFDYNPRYDQWTPRLAQKWMNLTWGERIFKCKDTGEEVLICGDMIYEGSFIPVGNGVIDIGRTNSYHRIIGNLEEIK